RHHLPMPEFGFSAFPEIFEWRRGSAVRRPILPTGVEGSRSDDSSAVPLPETTVRAHRNQRAILWARRSEQDAYSENPKPDDCRRRGTHLSSRNQELPCAVSYSISVDCNTDNVSFYRLAHLMM